MVMAAAAYHSKMRFFVRFVHYKTEPIFLSLSHSIHQLPTKAINPNEDIIKLCNENRLKEAMDCLDIMTKLNSETYAALLQACANTNALEEGKKIHTDMMINSDRFNTFEQNVFLENKLISMYAKCGSALDARSVFDGILKPNVISWNSMVRGYAMNGYFEEAVTLFYTMQGDGIKPDNFSFPSVLKACAGLSDLAQGSSIHGLLIKCGCESDVGVGNALVNMYAKCGSIGDALQVFDKMSQRGVVSWNVMIAGLSHNGYGHETLRVFSQMKLYGEKPNCVTLATVLPVCACLETIELGEQIHGYSIKNALESEVLVGNAFVTMYSKCGRIMNAVRVFDGINQKDLVSWNAMIAGYSQIGHCDLALDRLHQMIMAGVKPNEVTVVSVLSVCAHLAGIQQGKEIHGYIVKSGVESDISVRNALIDMYSKCEIVEYAIQVFDKIEQRDVISWNAMIAGYTQNGYFDYALNLFHQMQQAGLKSDSVTILSVLSTCSQLGDLQKGKEIHNYIIRSDAFEFDIAVSNALITFYACCGSLEIAYHIFDRMSQKDVVSWNAMLSAYAQNGCCNESVNLFQRMQMTSVIPDSTTISSVLSACAHLSSLKPGKEIHGYIIRNGSFNTDVVVGNALVDMYAKCGRIIDACHEFDKMSYRNVISANVMIAGYAKCGNKEAAQNVFDKMKDRNIGSWNAIIAMNAQNGYEAESLKLLGEMQLAGEEPDTVTIASVLSACAHIAALQRAKEIHSYIIRRGFDLDIFVKSAIIDTYAKCGSLGKAHQVFEKMPKRDVVTWTAMIFGYAIHGHGKDALSTFRQMQQVGLKPDHVTFTAVLSACSHAGLIDEGWQYFDCMTEEYCITPKTEHYACMVDLLGRAGRLDEAHDFIKSMPMEPNASMWGALLAACRIHCNIELGEHIAEKLFQLEPVNTGNHILLSNIYAAAGMWDGVKKIRKLMKDKGLNKIPGCSWILVQNKVHAFSVEDTTSTISSPRYL